MSKTLTKRDKLRLIQRRSTPRSRRINQDKLRKRLIAKKVNLICETLRKMLEEG